MFLQAAALNAELKSFAEATGTLFVHSKELLLHSTLQHLYFYDEQKNIHKIQFHYKKDK